MSTATTKTAPQAAATSFQFLTPAAQQDFPNDPSKQQALNNQWNLNLTGFTNQSINGNPWNAENAANITNYVNPANTPLPSNTQYAPIEWIGFPGRISYYFPTLPQKDVYSLADTGYQTNGQSFPQITKDPCTGLSVAPKAYGPYGPRGWQDEYCEWSVTRNNKGQITRIDFTCENPEYWNSLWMVDPHRVLELYRSTLSKPQIQLEDLYLRDWSTNQPTIDPSTGRPAYNGLNKWNTGPLSTDSKGGAMHLTSTPNTLQTEIGLAGAATSQRTTGNTDFNKLICCAQYGQPHRNSDPNIGGSVNQVVGAGNFATLANPPGLYIQKPNFSKYVTPDGTKAETFWTITRGKETLSVDGKQLPGNFILHAVFEVPANKGYTVSDIKINGAPIDWAGQIVETFSMHIIAAAYGGQVPATQNCVSDTPAQNTYAQPLQLFHKNVYHAMRLHPVENPVQQSMSLLSNSTLIAPIVEQGQTSVEMAITASTVTVDPDYPQTWPTVKFDGNDITVVLTGVNTVKYAVPGNSYPADTTVIFMKIDISASAQTGLRSVYITNKGQQPSTAMPALLNVVPAGTIHQTKSAGL